MNTKINQFWDSKYLVFRKIRDGWFSPLSKLLIDFRITPNMVTFFRLFLAVIIPVLLGWNYWLVVVLMIVNLILDGVDGAMARILNKSSYQGKVFDLITDNLTFVLFLLGLIFWKVADGFWGAFYLVNYLIAIFFGLQFQDLKGDEFVMSKSRYILLLVFLILTVAGINWIDYVCVFCAVYLCVENIFMGYQLIRKL